MKILKHCEQGLPCVYAFFGLESQKAVSQASGEEKLLVASQPIASSSQARGKCAKMCNEIPVKMKG